MIFLRNFNAANKKRNIKRFGLFALNQNIDWIDDMPPDPPQINRLVFTPTPVFDAASGNILSMILLGDVTLSSIVYTGPAAPIPTGTQVTLRIEQDAVGGHHFALPSNLVLDAGVGVDLDPLTVTWFPLMWNGSKWECYGVVYTTPAP